MCVSGLYLREGRWLLYIDGGIGEAQLVQLENWQDVGAALARTFSRVPNEVVVRHSGVTVSLTT